MIELLTLLWLLFKCWRKIGSWVVMFEIMLDVSKVMSSGMVAFGFPSSNEQWRMVGRKLWKLEADCVLWPRVVRRIKDRMDNDQNGRFNF
jgi:hypothetical protein